MAFDDTPGRRTVLKSAGALVAASGLGATGYSLATTNADTVAPPEEQWRSHYGGEASDRGHAVSLAQTDGFALAGQNVSADKEPDAWLIETDADGTQQWDVTIGGDEREDFFAVTPVSSGGYLLGGYTNSDEVHGETIDKGGRGWVVKTDGDGTFDWQAHPGNDTLSDFRDVAEFPDGGYVAGGLFSKSAWLAAYDTDGTLRWENTYNPPYNEDIESESICNSLTVTTDGGVAFAGFAPDIERGWIVKVDADGEQEWATQFDRDPLYDIVQREDGAFAVCGEDYGGYRLAFLNADGEVTDSHTYEPPTDAEALPYGLAQTGDTGYLIAGRADGTWVVKTAADGTKQWELTPEGGLVSEYNPLTYLGGEEFVLVGTDGDRDAFLAKFAPASTETETKTETETDGETATPTGTESETATPTPTETDDGLPDEGSGEDCPTG